MKGLINLALTLTIISLNEIYLSSANSQAEKNLKSAELFSERAKRLRNMYDDLLKMQNENEYFYREEFVPMRYILRKLDKMLSYVTGEEGGIDPPELLEKFIEISSSILKLDLKELLKVSTKFGEIIGKFQDRELEIINTNYRDYKEFHKFFESLIPPVKSTDDKPADNEGSDPEVSEVHEDAIDEGVEEILVETHNLFEELQEDQEKAYLGGQVGLLLGNNPEIVADFVKLQNILMKLIKFQKGQILQHDEL